MPRVWRYHPFDEARVRQLCAELRVSPLLAQVLLARGYGCRKSATEFLSAKLNDLHDPLLLPGCEDAAEAIVRAVHGRRRITVYGDYDVDGVTATAILWHCLKLTGANVDYYIPSRLEEGYGLNEQALRRLHAEDPRRLVVSVDCGIASLHEAALCRELGLELIVTDHHAFATPPGPPLARGGSAIPPLGKGGLGGVDSGENVRTPPLVRGGSAGPRLPEATVLVHPRLPGSEYPFGELCGAGVALKLAWSICRRLGDGRKASPAMREFLMGAVGLAALGTVADVVPLCGENRILVRYGLSSLLERPSTGLKALLNVAGLGDRRCLEAEHIGFALAPRINAAGRLGQARLAVELLTTGDPERAEALAKYLDELNGKRKTVERRIFKRARQLVDEHPDWEHAPALVLADADWHPGVIGIVASRIAEHYGRPALLLAVDAESGLAQGSGRTFAGFDLHAALAGCGGLLVSFGGHQAAAGLKLAADRVDEFREEFCRVVAARHTAASRDLEIRIDAEVRLADVHRHAVVELDRLGPFGCENPKPVFAATNVELVEPPRRMGEGEHHLSLRVRQYGTVLRAIAFGRGEWADEIAKCGGPLSIGFTAGLNTYKGFERVELQLEDWNAAGA